MRAVDAPAPERAEPSWGRVLATTVRLSVSWRLRALGAGQPRSWSRLAALALVLVAAAAAALWGTGALTGQAGPPRRAARPAAAAAVVRAQAAAWVAGQVSTDAMVACDPGMCAALAERGVPSGRLVELTRPAAIGRLGAGIIVAAAPVPGPLAVAYAPALIASFGSGAARIDVRRTVPGGAAAYTAAVRADAAARRSAGSQLLQNGRLTFTARAAAQVRAGHVDARLLVTLAALSSRYAFRVARFGDASPGAPVLFREVDITPGGRGGGPGELAGALNLVNEQGPPYLPAHAATSYPAALHIEFAAPSPLGLLTQVLVLDPQPAAG
jgi:hypothetical protein